MVSGTSLKPFGTAAMCTPTNIPRKDGSVTSIFCTRYKMSSTSASAHLNPSKLIPLWCVTRHTALHQTPGGLILTTPCRLGMVFLSSMATSHITRYRNTETTSELTLLKFPFRTRILRLKIERSTRPHSTRPRASCIRTCSPKTTVRARRRKGARVVRAGRRPRATTQATRHHRSRSPRHFFNNSNMQTMRGPGTAVSPRPWATPLASTPPSRVKDLPSCAALGPGHACRMGV